MKYKKIVERYEKCLALHGDTHKGVDWPNEEGAKTRYKIMRELIKHKPCSLLDFGCGTASIYEYLDNDISYTGMDISEKFIEVAKNKYPNLEFICGDIFKMDISFYDYIIMNGVLTVKDELSYLDMFDYFKQIIVRIFKFCRKGIAFNVMSKLVDWEKDYLFHVPIKEMVDFISTLTRKFQIRHDYGLFEYTVYIYVD